VKSSPHAAPPRWLLYAGLWLLLSCVFSTQLYLAGYVTPWRYAFAGEAIYWLSWWILAPLIFWYCRRLQPLPWSLRAPALLLGALVAVFASPMLAQSMNLLAALTPFCTGGCVQAKVPFTPGWFTQVVRVAGVNLPVYAGVVLAWHAGTFYREARDRQMQALELAGLLHQAQLEALRSQLNPHFLFNALHSMAELVHSDPKLAEQLLVRLGELLRQVLQSSARQEVTLAEELEFIRGYVAIEQMRLGERLTVSWDVDPATLQARVPSLVLQPLVENAIQHGIAATSAPGTLSLAARRDGEFLQLEVRDNGPGLARASAVRTPADGSDGSSNSNSNGIGIANTRARLERLYGARQSFDLQAGEGLAVRLRIPLSMA